MVREICGLPCEPRPRHRQRRRLAPEPAPHWVPQKREQRRPAKPSPLQDVSTPSSDSPTRVATPQQLEDLGTETFDPHAPVWKSVHQYQHRNLNADRLAGLEEWGGGSPAREVAQDRAAAVEAPTPDPAPIEGPAEPRDRLGDSEHQTVQTLTEISRDQGAVAGLRAALVWRYGSVQEAYDSLDPRGRGKSWRVDVRDIAQALRPLGVPLEQILGKSLAEVFADLHADGRGRVPLCDLLNFLPLHLGGGAQTQAFWLWYNNQSTVLQAQDAVRRPHWEIRMRHMEEVAEKEREQASEWSRKLGHLRQHLRWQGEKEAEARQASSWSPRRRRRPAKVLVPEAQRREDDLREQTTRRQRLHKLFKGLQESKSEVQNLQTLMKVATAPEGCSSPVTRSARMRAASMSSVGGSEKPEDPPWMTTTSAKQGAAQSRPSTVGLGALIQGAMDADKQARLAPVTARKKPSLSTASPSVSPKGSGGESLEERGGVLSSAGPLLNPSRRRVSMAARAEVQSIPARRRDHLQATMSCSRSAEELTRAGG